MKTSIYYFSGTGNSLAIAKQLSERIDDSKTISIPQIIKNEKEITGEAIGIVCPIYMYNMPLLVADFIKKIKNAEYIFFVFAGAGGLGNGDKELTKLFTEQKLNLNAWFNIPMPDNYTPYGGTSEEKQQKLFKASEDKVKKIVEIVQTKGVYEDKVNTGFFKANVYPGILYKMGYGRINILDQSFTVDDTCNGCSICQKVCPVNNVTMENDKPVWNKQCQQCYACLQWCPKEAIQVGKKTEGVKRYHHPDIKVKEIIAASGN